MLKQPDDHLYTFCLFRHQDSKLSIELMKLANDWCVKINLITFLKFIRYFNNILSIPELMKIKKLENPLTSSGRCQDIDDIRWGGGGYV